MNATRCIRSPFRWLASGVGLAAAAYATYVGATWCRYGQPRHESSRKAADPLFDRFMPEFEVVERCRVRVAAPAEITWSAACEMDLQQSAIVRGIFKAPGTDSGQRAGRNHRSTGAAGQDESMGVERAGRNPRP